MLFNKFIEEHELSNNLKLLAKVFLHNVNKDSWKKMFVGQPYVEDFVQHLNDFIQSTELGNTAEFWMQYTNHVSLCLTLIKALKTSNFYLYQYCLIQICDLFGHAVANIVQDDDLTFFSTDTLDVNKNYPGAEKHLKRGALSVARSFIPENRYAADKTIEKKSS